TTAIRRRVITFYAGLALGWTGPVLADNPITWSGPVPLLVDQGYYGDHPSVASSEPRTAHVAFWQQLSSRTRTDTYVSSSWDGGLTWSAPLLIENDPDDQYGADAPSVCTDETGHVYVAWSANGPFASFTSVNRSDDDGQTWLASPLTVTTYPN